MASTHTSWNWCAGAALASVMRARNMIASWWGRVGMTVRWRMRGPACYNAVTATGSSYPVKAAVARRFYLGGGGLSPLPFALSFLAPSRRYTRSKLISRLKHCGSAADHRVMTDPIIIIVTDFLADWLFSWGVD